MNTIRKTFAAGVATLALGAGIAATTTPAEAQWRGHRGYHHHGGYHGGWRGPAAAGVIGGLALGALAAQAGPRYYGYPAYGYGDGYATPVTTCFNRRRPAYDAWGNFAGYRVVRVCR